MSKHLILIRHGEAETPKPGCFIGSTDAPLTDKGRLQAGSLAGRFSNKCGARCFCSPLSRTVDTARLAMASAGLDLTHDSELREIDFGLWEGLTFPEIQAADPGAVDKWARYDPEFRFPQGESIGEFLRRVRAAGDRLAGDDAETVVLFTHGGVIRTLICHFLGLDCRNYLLFDVAPASVTTLRLFDGTGVLAGAARPAADAVRLSLFDRRGVLAGLNDVSHLGVI